MREIRHVELTETCETRHEVTECTEPREIEGELDGVSDEHTHTEVVEDHGGELAERVETRCRQLVGLLRERGEVVCPLEADHDQVGSVVPGEVEGASAVNGCTRSLGGIETPEPLVVARVPSVIVPVCAVKGANETPCMSETPCEWCGHECAGVRASQRTVSKRGRVCE